VAPNGVEELGCEKEAASTILREFEGNMESPRQALLPPAQHRLRKLRLYGFDGALVRKIEMSELTSTAVLFREVAAALETELSCFDLSEDIPGKRKINPDDPSTNVGHLKVDLIYAFRKKEESQSDADEKLARRLQREDLTGAAEEEEDPRSDSRAKKKPRCAGPPGITTQRDVAGVKGLHIVYDVFTEDVEQRIFLDRSIFEEASKTAERECKALHARQWSTDMFRVVNAVRDSGLYPELTLPNWSFNYTYPEGGMFRPHNLSTHRWGVAQVGVCLGRGGLMTLQETTGAGGDGRPKKITGTTVHVELPRRCIYIMLDECRNHWVHGILKMTPARLEHLPAPAWNPQGYRRSLKFRSSKLYSDIMEKRHHPQATGPLRDRIDFSAGQYAAENSCGSKKLNKTQLELETAAAHREVDALQFSADPYEAFEGNDVRYTSIY